MKAFLSLSLGLALWALCDTTAFAHEEDSRVAIEAETASTVSAGKVQYVFQLVDTELNKVLKDTDLQATHEKILHMLIYDPSLKEFQHVHPEFDGQYWRVDLNFSINGQYWIWAQGKLKSDGEEFSSSARLTVQDGSPEWSTPPVLTDVRIGQDGNSVATLGADKIMAGKMMMLDLKFSRNDGSQPSITPYLGAFAHVVSVYEDADSLIHVHPMSTDNPNEGMLHVTFPDPGFYRLWIQFMDANQLRTVPLSVQVY